MSETIVIIIGIIGWWCDKQYDRYIEDLIEEGELKQRKSCEIQWPMYRDNQNIRDWVERTIWDKYVELEKQGKKKEADRKLEEFMGWSSPMRITKKESREKFNLKIYLLKYILLNIPNRVFDWFRDKK